MNYTINEIMPKDGRKSFYGKAVVFHFDNGTDVLRSYNTIVAVRDRCGNVYKTWNKWSATTGRHIAAFLGMNKKEFAKLSYHCDLYNVLSKCGVDDIAVFMGRVYTFNGAKTSKNLNFGYNKYI
nr:MAG TPA: hypothetical protein [Caudoviricetes sp.]